MTRASLRQVGVLLALIAVAAATCLLRLLIDRQPEGPVTLAWPEASFAMYRWTAMAAGAIVGASLGIAGLMLQALLRNPLAEPFILGLSSGAGLGVMAAMYAAHAAGAAALSEFSETLPAAAGALAVLGLVYALSQRRGWLDPISTVLIGVVVSTVCGAGIMFFQHLVPTGLRGEFTTWLMGAIPETTRGWTLPLAGAMTLVGFFAGIGLGRSMDAATLGDDEARSVGLAVGPLRLALFLIAGALTAISVTLAGPIGFVGLIAPHVGRLCLGPRHGPLVPAAALIGVTIIVGADVGRQAIELGGGRMPIGIFTALVGGPVFIWLLRSGRGQA